MIDVWGTWDQPGKTVGPYLHYGYGMANFDMGGVIHRVVKQIERAGYKAMAHAVATNCHYRSNGDPVPYWTTRPDWSQPHAAVAAGLGEFGLLGILISRRFGTHVRLGSIITDAPLTVDPMYSGPPLCVPGRAATSASESARLTRSRRRRPPRSGSAIGYSGRLSTTTSGAARL